MATTACGISSAWVQLRSFSRCSFRAAFGGRSRTDSGFTFCRSATACAVSLHLVRNRREPTKREGPVHDRTYAAPGGERFDTPTVMRALTALAWRLPAPAQADRLDAVT